MTHSELREWEDYLSMNPLPAQVQEIQLATVSFLISSSNGGKSKLNDFLVSNKDNNSSKSIGGMSAEEIDKLLGV